jgi:hypothetical protein
MESKRLKSRGLEEQGIRRARGKMKQKTGQDKCRDYRAGKAAKLAEKTGQAL